MKENDEVKEVEELRASHLLPLNFKDPLVVLTQCGGYYECPLDSDGLRTGPLVGYAGKYKAPDGTMKQYVGDVYASFPSLEIWPHLLDHIAVCLGALLNESNLLDKTNTFCGAPLGGYSLSDALARASNRLSKKAEKKVLALSTENEREKSGLVFGRHSINPCEGVIIVEDVCNNFSTTDKLIALIESCGGKVIGIACFLNRSLTVDTHFQYGKRKIPVISLVRKAISQYRQDDPEVADDIKKGNVVWKPKDHWGELMRAMQENAMHD